MSDDKTSPKASDTLLILPLAISRGITNLPTVVVSILLIEIAATYNVTPPIASQLNTASSLMGIIFALIMGILSVRYDHRTMLLLGLIIYALSAASGFVSGSLMILLLLYATTGVAYAIINPMINSLIGTNIPAERRTSVIGYTMGCLAFIYAVGSLSAAYLSKVVDWQMALLLVVAPISIVNLVLALLFIPHTKRQASGNTSLNLLSGYRESLRNVSVLACLIGTAIGMAVWNIYLLYSSSYMRQTFGVSASFCSEVVISFAFMYIVGCLLTGRLARRLGRKTLTVYSISLVSFLSLFAMVSSSVYMYIGIGTVVSVFAGMLVTIQASLTLDQVPQFRGTVMSLSSASVSLGSMMAAVAGGIIISFFGYGIYAITMGVIGFIGAATFHFFAKEPH